jgi:hypothetical protein
MLDMPFSGGNGCAITSVGGTNVVRSVALGSDGKIVVAGYAWVFVVRAFHASFSTQDRH